MTHTDNRDEDYVPYGNFRIEAAHERERSYGELLLRLPKGNHSSLHAFNRGDLLRLAISIIDFLDPEPRDREDLLGAVDAAQRVETFLDAREGARSLDPIDIIGYNGIYLKATDLRVLVSAAKA